MSSRPRASPLTSPDPGRHRPPASDPDEPDPDEPKPEHIRLRLDVSYDGTAYAGWARQAGQRTVQGEIESALAVVLRLPEAPSLTVAGRTDAGVHARGQVAHVDLDVERWQAADSLVRRLAGVLPPDVRIRDVSPAPSGFDARFSPLWRRYAYRVGVAAAGVDPLRRHCVLWHPRPVRLGALQEAAAVLVGEHDFAAFCRRREGATTVRTLLELRWENPEPDLFVARLRADAFCHSMVRSLVGAMLAVGEGRRDVAWLAAALAGRTRKPDIQVLPPHGLTLEEVRYPSDEDLAARAIETRRMRPLLPPRTS